MPSARAWSAAAFPVPRMRHGAVAYFEGLHRTQGDVARVRYGSRALVLVSHPEDLRRILVTEEELFPRARTRKTLRRLEGEEPGSLLGPGIEPDLHLRVRRVLQPAFSRARIESAWGAMVDVARGHTQRWSGQESIELVPELQLLTMQLTTAVVFGEELALPIDEVVAGKAACIALRSHSSSPLFAALDALKLRRRLRGLDAYERLTELLAGHLAERRAASSDGPDFLDRLLALGEQEGLGDAALANEALAALLTMNYGGVGAVAWALYHLAALPEELDLLRADTDALLGGGAARPERLEAVVKETLRLHPTFTLVARSAREDCVFRGVPVRAGDLVVICPYLVHRDPRWWPDATRFDPDRWSRDDSARPQLAYVPFGAGSRKCIGAHVATAVVSATLTVMASLFDLSDPSLEPSPRATRPLGLRMRARPRRELAAAVGRVGNGKEVATSDEAEEAAAHRQGRRDDAELDEHVGHANAVGSRRSAGLASDSETRGRRAASLRR